MWVLHQNTWNLAWTAVNGTGISNHLSFWNIKFMFWVAFYGGKNRWASSLWQVVLLNLLEFNTNLSVQRWLWYDSISSLQIYHVAKKHWFGRFHKLMLYIYLLTKAAVVSKLLLKTRHAVIATLFGNQRFRSYWLSAMLTHKAGFMPVVTLKFHFAGTWTPKVRVY